MPSPLTEAERQSLAFGQLRKETLAAQWEEDGLSINLLCSTASETIDSLHQKGTLMLSVKDIAWVQIFQLYWMLDFHGASITVDTINKIIPGNTNEQALRLFLDCHWYLLSEPMSGWAPAKTKLYELNLTIFSDYQSDNAPEEYIELVQHLIELAWFRCGGTQDWIDFLSEWRKQAPPWILGLISVLEARLGWQTRLIVPNDTSPNVTEAEIQQLAVCSELAELWLLNLYGRHDAVVNRVKVLTSRLPINSYKRRIVLDFWHINRSFVKNVSAKLSARPGEQNPITADSEGAALVARSYQEVEKRAEIPREESQLLWLARRRRVSATVPLFQFHDRRELEIEEELAALYRERDESNAYKRYEAMRLAMLHELAAMRIWDFGMWRDAVKAQSDVWLDSTLWIKDDAGCALRGLLLGARALSLKISKDDVLTNTSIERLEFAPSDLLLFLGGQLLTAYPLAKYSASQLIDEIADLLPSSLWPALAEWTAIASRELDEHRSTGSKIGFVTFWWKLLPGLDQASPIWTVLFGEVLKMAAIPHCWNGRYGDFLLLWMRHAPISLCRQVADVIIGVVTSNEQRIFSLYRSELLVDAEEARPELNHDCTSRLPNPAPTQEERLLLAEHLKFESYPAEANAARQLFATKLSERIDKMVPPEGQPSINLPMERIGTARIREWLPEDKPLFEKLLTAIQHPRVTRQYIPELLNGVQLMIAFGPIEFAQLARPAVASWVQCPPQGMAQINVHSGPLTGYHVTEVGLDHAREQLGWIVFQYVKIEGEGALDMVDAFLEGHLRYQWRRSVGILCRCLIVLATKLTPEPSKQKIQAVRELLGTLRAQMTGDSSVGNDLSSALSFLVGLFGPQRRSIIEWENSEGTFVLNELIGVLDWELVPLATASTVQIRLNVARALANLSQWRELPIGLKEVLDRLSTDKRARVRRAAKVSNL